MIGEHVFCSLLGADRALVQGRQDYSVEDVVVVHGRTGFGLEHDAELRAARLV